MVKTLKNAIAKKLKETFPEFTVYVANPAQNIKEPCFIIEVRNQEARDLTYVPGNVRQISEMYFSFTVTILIPRNNELLNDVMTRVLLCLKWLTLEDGRLVLTLNRESNPIDDSSGIVTFNIYREAHVMGDEPPVMKELQENIGLKK